MFGQCFVEVVQRDTAFKADKTRSVVNVDFKQTRYMVEVDEPG